MDWSPDFCLACDRQTSGEAYCSQSCRLADIENSNGSEPVSPTGVTAPASWAPSNLARRSAFYLPPPVNFDAYRGKLPSKRSSATTNTSRLPPSLPAKTSYLTAIPFRSRTASSPVAAKGSSPGGLTPSSSGSSLSSMQSAISSEAGSLSDQARSELRGYANSFDQVRDWKRRITL